MGQDLWIRPGLRHHGLRQEVRAQVQIDQATGCRTEGPELEETAQRKEEQDEEGQRYQEGQGRSRWKEVNGYTVNNTRVQKSTTAFSILWLRIFSTSKYAFCCNFEISA